MHCAIARANEMDFQRENKCKTQEIQSSFRFYGIRKNKIKSSKCVQNSQNYKKNELIFQRS